MCHEAQHAVWSQSHHAKAFATLGTDKAKEIGKQQGIEDPQKSGQCLKCHVTGYGDKRKIIEEYGIQCESCHGAGKGYATEKIMKNLELSKEKGLIMPTEAVCKECHNSGSPTFKSFNFEKAFEMIKHQLAKK
jgi:hypothetical protein